jgi:hypothetical protein
MRTCDDYRIEGKLPWLRGRCCVPRSRWRSPPSPRRHQPAHRPGRRFQPPRPPDQPHRRHRPRRLRLRHRVDRPLLLRQHVEGSPSSPPIWLAHRCVMCVCRSAVRLNGAGRQTAWGSCGSPGCPRARIAFGSRAMRSSSSSGKSRCVEVRTRRSTSRYGQRLHRSWSRLLRRRRRRHRWLPRRLSARSGDPSR